MAEGLLSIIIPVFDTDAALLKECVQSVLEQDYRDFEIIVIDDGSSNVKTLEVIDGLSGLDSRIVTIRTSNKGVSSARNTGLDAISGDLVMFVDSDDSLCSNACSSLVAAQAQTGADVVIGRFQGEGSPFYAGDDDGLAGVLDVDELEALRLAVVSFRTMDYQMRGFSPDSPWAKLFTKSVIDQVGARFPEHLSRSEDAAFCLQIYELARVAMLQNVVYSHQMNKGSLVESCSDNCVRMLPSILEFNEGFCSEFHDGDSNYAKANGLRALEGIKEAYNKYFFHPSNTETKSALRKEFMAFVSNSVISCNLSSLAIDDIASKSDQLRLKLLQAGRYRVLFALEQVWRKVRG